MNAEIISERIKLLLGQEFKTLRDAAKALNFGYNQLSAMLNSHRSISVQLYDALVEYGFSLDFIMTGKGFPKLKYYFPQPLSHLTYYDCQELLTLFTHIVFKTFSTNYFSTLEDYDIEPDSSFIEEEELLLGWIDSNALSHLNIDRNKILIIQNYDFHEFYELEELIINPEYKGSVSHRWTLFNEMKSKLSEKIFIIGYSNEFYIGQIYFQEKNPKFENDDIINIELVCHPELDFSLDILEAIGKFQEFNFVAFIDKIIDISTVNSSLNTPNDNDDQVYKRIIINPNIPSRRRDRKSI